MVYDEDFEDEFEDDEYEDEEFDDEFEDEFADDFEDEFSSFGPVYIQGETSVNFEAYAMVASFAVVFLSVWMLFSNVMDPVYDGMSSANPSDFDGLGRKLATAHKDAPDSISFAPPSIEVIGVGRYDASTSEDGTYDYAVLAAGSEQGIGIGLVYMLHDQDGKPSTKMVITAVEPQMSRADFIEIADGDIETVNISRSYTDPENRISHIHQDEIWQRETIRELLLMLDDGWRDRGITEEAQIDAMERFATLGVPNRTGKPIFNFADNIPSFDSGNEDAMGRAQLQVFNQLVSLSPSDATTRLRAYINERQPPWKMETVNGVSVPAPVFVPQEAPLSPIMRDALVAEATDTANWAVARSLPHQFPDVNSDWNIITYTSVSEDDLVGKDSALITSELISNGKELFNLGRPISGVRAYLVESGDQKVISMVLDKLTAEIAASDTGGN